MPMTNVCTDCATEYKSQPIINPSMFITPDGSQSKYEGGEFFCIEDVSLIDREWFDFIESGLEVDNSYLSRKMGAVRLKMGFVCKKCKKSVLAYKRPKSCKDHD